MELFTGTFSKHLPDHGLAVRTTIGYPRWTLPYTVINDFRLATPDRTMLDLPKDEFRDAYYAKLERFGKQRINEDLLNIARVHGEEKLVLLCFDNLTKPDVWCHRTMFAEWWLEQTGDLIIENAPPIEDTLLPDLFTELKDMEG